MLTGCASKSSPKPSKSPQVTIDSPSVTQDLTPKASDPILNPAPGPTSKTPLKPPIFEPNSPKTTPKPTTSPSPKTVQFDVPIPWEETPPGKLALPWTSIAPEATTATIAIVRLNSNSILVAANRGLFRTAFIVDGVVGFRIQKHQGSETGDVVFVTCPNGGEVGVGFFAAHKTWNATYHPSTYTLRPVEQSEDVCSSLSNTD
jgi:hypothetical protein